MANPDQLSDEEYGEYAKEKTGEALRAFSVTLKEVTAAEKAMPITSILMAGGVLYGHLASVAEQAGFTLEEIQELFKVGFASGRDLDIPDDTKVWGKDVQKN